MRRREQILFVFQGWGRWGVGTRVVFTHNLNGKNFIYKRGSGKRLPSKCGKKNQSYFSSFCSDRYCILIIQSHFIFFVRQYPPPSLLPLLVSLTSLSFFPPGTSGDGNVQNILVAKLCAVQILISIFLNFPPLLACGKAKKNN